MEVFEKLCVEKNSFQSLVWVIDIILYYNRFFIKFCNCFIIYVTQNFCSDRNQNLRLKPLIFLIESLRIALGLISIQRSSKAGNFKKHNIFWIMYFFNTFWKAESISYASKKNSEKFTIVSFFDVHNINVN